MVSGPGKTELNPINLHLWPGVDALYGLWQSPHGWVWKRPDSDLRQPGLQLFGLELALNFIWSILFFRYHRIGLQRPSEVLLLWLAILATMAVFLW